MLKFFKGKDTAPALMNESDAAEAMSLLIKAFKFKVNLMQQTEEMRSASGYVVTTSQWTAKLIWDKDDLKHLEEVYVCHGNEVPETLSATVMTQDAWCPMFVHRLSGAVLKRFDRKSGSYTSKCDIPKFNSLNELRLLLSIQGLI